MFGDEIEFCQVESSRGVSSGNRGKVREIKVWGVVS